MTNEDLYLKILELNKQLYSIKNLQDVLSTILDNAIQLSQAERGFILVGKEIQMARNFDQEWLQDPGAKLSYSIANKVIKSGETLITTNAQNDPNITCSQSIQELHLRFIICIPLKIEKRVLGVLYLDNRFMSEIPQKEELFFLEAFAEQASLALFHSQTINSLENKIASLQKELQQYSYKPNEEINTSMILESSYLGQKIFRFGKSFSIEDCMQELFAKSLRAARTDVPILILGESGSGKGLLASSIHESSLRSEQPFIAENCAAIPETLLESELFGVKKGAFTGAVENRDGLFQRASGGTLFLDEVGDMPLSMQSKLLKVLETNMVRPVGSLEWQKVDIRLITATHRDLAQMVKEKKFREDLWYRLCVVTLEIPPLRKRPQDIEFLTQYFLEQNQDARKKHIRKVSQDAWKIMLKYDWPGNVRQLQHELEKIVVFKASNASITVEDLSTEILGYMSTSIPSKLPLKEAVAHFCRYYIEETLKLVGGDKTKAAKLLDISRRNLYNKLELPTDNSNS